MSRRLITQLAEDQPRVLLIGEETNLKQKIVDFLQRQDLSVTSLEKFDEKELTRFPLQDFYRIICLGSSDENSENLKYLPNLSNLLVVSLVNSLDERVVYFDLPDQIVGIDVVEDQKLLEKFKRIFENIDQGVLLDLRIDFFLQSQENFLSIIKHHLLTPQKEKILIKGQKQSSLSVLNEINRLINLIYKVDGLQIKESLESYSKLEFLGFETIQKEAEALPSLVESLVKYCYHHRSQEKTNNTEVYKNTYHAQSLVRPNVSSVTSTTSTPMATSVERLRVTATLPNFKSVSVEKAPVKNKITSSEATSLTPEIKQEKIDSAVAQNPSIDERLSQIFKEKRVDEKVERVQGFVKETKKIKKITKKRKTLFGLGVLMTVLATSMIFLAGFYWFSVQNVEARLEGVFRQISEGNTQINYSPLLKSASVLEKQAFVYGQVLPPEMLSGAENILEITKKISEYESLSSEYQAMILNSVQVVLGKDLLNDSVDGQNQAKKAQSLQEVSSKLLARLNDLKKAKTKEDDQQKVTSFIDLINGKKNSLMIYQQLSPVLDELLGKEKKKTYALVFQNNQELRPTGGFLQAVAVITVDKGMIVDSQVYSSYELDQKLGGAVVPPDEVIKLLGENKWYLRDSNWDPDFSVSGKQIAWFLEQQLNKNIDGVVGINLYVMQNFLREIGPLDLAEFNEVITDKNLFERSEFHSEIKLVDTSAVEDYQAKLLKYLIRDVVSKGQDNPQKLLNALKTSLQEKQMTLYFDDDNLSSAISGLGWSGELVIPQCPTQLSTLPCHVDALVVNESNIGINKANYHTTRQDSHNIEIANNQIKHQRTITLNNEAFSNAWPKGEYRSYFRFYLPEHAQSVALTVDGQKIQEKDVLIAKQGNNLVLGLLVSTPIKTKKNIELSYTVPLEFSSPYSYVFFSQKQPGTKDVLQNVVLKHSPDLSPTLIAPKADVSGDTINFHDLAEDHAFVGVSFK
ncbi:DUF4012 domain-containing protein [Patescibacteria group bacterium]|nr:DUF4012 domain-containing protein [Patescibacteria group bacterium]